MFLSMQVVPYTRNLLTHSRHQSLSLADKHSHHDATHPFPDHRRTCWSDKHQTIYQDDQDATEPPRHWCFLLRLTPGQSFVKMSHFQRWNSLRWFSLWKMSRYFPQAQRKWTVEAICYSVNCTFKCKTVQRNIKRWKRACSFSKYSRQNRFQWEMQTPLQTLEVCC